MSLEKTIFNNLIFNEDYTRKVIPFIKSEYFHDRYSKVVFEIIDSYISKYNSLPSKEVLSIELDNKNGLDELTYKECKSLIEEISAERNEVQSNDWLIEQTEKFCQDRAIYNAIHTSIKIMEDPLGHLQKGAIPELLSTALGVCFDTSIGHDYIEDFESRYDFYHAKQKRIPFDIEILNKISGGGLPTKTLNILLAGTGVGKSLCMCHFAAHNLLAGQNVLYITLEMAEERIAERIDANLLDVTLDDLKILPKSAYLAKMSRLKAKNLGKLVIKEYPTASAGSANFRHLINELRIKKNFIPDIVYIDYLNICCSSRIKSSANANTYVMIKAIAEELRGLAVEFSIPIVSATQTTRSGYDNSDVSITDTSESFGLPATADFMLAAITTDELRALGQIMFKQLKNRYGDPEKFKRFVVGIDRSKMRLYDVEDSAQKDIIDDTPVFNNTNMGKNLEYYDPETGEISDKKTSKFSKAFENFK